MQFDLNNLTMYRLMQYYLRFLLTDAVVLSYFKILPYNFVDIILVCLYLVVACYIFNQLFAKIFRATTNLESQLITGIILSLIVGPIPFLENYIFLTILAAIAMGSKYILAINKRHIFNPAAIAVVLSAIFLGQGASWWVGSSVMFTPVVIGGLYVNYKIKQLPMVTTFLVAYVLAQSAALLYQGLSLTDLAATIQTLLLDSPILFFVFVMFPEPVTAPPTKILQIRYAVFTGLLLVILQTFASSVPYTLELSLVVANLTFYVQAIGRRRISAKLLEKEELAPGITAFWFQSNPKLTYAAGQFSEWTIPHKKPDSRGIRRYFTIASSPTEPHLLLTTRFSDPSSTFKSALNNLELNSSIDMSRVDGDFTLPRDSTRPCIFIAGGIGITPFRSMLKFCVDTERKQPITLFYSVKSPKDVVFSDVIKEATEKIGLKVIYVVSDTPPPGWTGETGFVTPEIVSKHVPHYKDQLVYISGPEPMIEALGKSFLKAGLPKQNLKHDYFPGYSGI